MTGVQTCALPILSDFDDFQLSSSLFLKKTIFKIGFSNASTKQNNILMGDGDKREGDVSLI